MQLKNRKSKDDRSARSTVITLGVILLIFIAAGIGYWIGGLQDDHAPSQMSQSKQSSATASDTDAQPTTLYTCGMHPEVITEEPGTCPKCGMNLTPMEPDRARMILEARGESVPEGGTAEKKDRKVLYWRAPMDPTYIRNEQGKSPMGMDLVPVYEDDVAGGPTIRIDPVTEQNMGLRYDVVRMGPLEKTVRTVGNVEYDEQSLGTVSPKISGWVEKVHVDQTGTQVHNGDSLFEIYSPELFSAQEEYLGALRDFERAKSDGHSSAAELANQRLRSARERLLFFDITEKQIEQLKETRKIRKTLTITAQLTGIVTHKNIVEGDYLKAGAEAYKIADLSNVWVIAKVYESDMPYIELGQEAQMQLDFMPGRTYRGRVTYVYPYLEKGTREVPVRMEFHNPGYDLKPGMYATIRIKSRIDDNAVLVPTMAVISTGERQVAFVSREPGKFEPRQVRTGVRTGTDEFQVLSGLAPGEKIVVSGQFMLDSESRLREATLKMLSPGLQNTSDFLEEEADAHEHAAEEEDTRPREAKYVCPMPSHAGILYDQPGDCPLCKMRMVPTHPWHTEQQVIDHYTCPMPEHYDIHEEKPGKCEICGMTLIPVTEEDIQRFEKVPAGDIPQTLYTCPMPVHAGVVSDEAGKCPECGMKLVPTASVPHGEQAEERWQMERQEAGEGMSVLYTCPMQSHAHVVSDEPGRCPECNMRLVPTSDVEHGPESEQMWREDHPSTKTAGRSSDITLYTCPMESHAHIVTGEPGRCPECNMQLVPTSDVEHGPQAEQTWAQQQQSQ